MRRRDLLKAGLASTAVGATASPAMAADPVGRCLDRIDLQLERIRERVGPFLSELPSFTEEPGLSGALQGALDAMVAYGGVASLDAKHQEDPRVQERLWTVAETMGQSMERFALELDSLDDARLEALHDHLAANPELVEASVSALEAETRELDIPKPAREQLLRTVRETAFDLGKGQRSGATKRHLARYKRLRRRVQESERRMDLLERPPAEEIHARAAQAAGTPTAEGIEVAEPVAYDAGPDSHKVLGALLIALGVVNGALFTYGVIGSGGFLALCVCVGVPMLAAAILLMVAGASLMAPDTGRF